MFKEFLVIDLTFKRDLHIRSRCCNSHVPQRNVILFSFVIPVDLSATQGGDACLISYADCNEIFSQIMAIAGDINVRNYATIMLF